MSTRKITRALVSVFYKDNLEPIVRLLASQGVEFVSTGGTQDFIEKLGYNVTPVEKLTGYPSIFGGRVKTLHPAVFGGILYRRDDAGDVGQAREFNIAPIDLVIVDLYPFEETVAKGGSEEDIIEKIDIWSGRCLPTSSRSKPACTRPGPSQTVIALNNRDVMCSEFSASPSVASRIRPR
jgi:phosphoribosylaminoimidazolecarboxamide formyltransferase/IMP cyclohydrolase